MNQQKPDSACCGRAVNAVAPAASTGPRSAGGVDIRSLRAAIRLLEREIGAGLADQTACCSVSVPQCHVLTELDGAGCVNLTTLARLMSLDKSTLSRTVDALVAEGLVDRTVDPANRRSQIICLSSAGRQRVAAVNAVCDDYYVRLFGRIPAERQAAVAEAVATLARAMAETNQEDTNDCRCE